ncbi:Y-family DNA polymerase [Sphingorhabdus sp.]|uniref:Y-family DNA polymerase n=1 Tax=Sphingorhabdus sp. TaxID=1902408 RepID=UPI003BB09960
MAAYFPWLPAERLIRANTAPPDTPFALVEKQKGAMRLVALSQAAHLLGLAPGLPLADARARVPGLLAFDHDPAADSALLERLAEACLRYTPRVMVAPPQGLILDISGCHHLYDSNLSRAEKWLSDDLARRLGETRLTVRIACATASDAALALATFGLEEDAVHRLPVVALDCAPAVHHALQRAGLNHIGDLASRPRTILASRFGEDVTYRLARLLGEVDSPIIPRRSRPAVLCEARFAEPIAHSETVRAVLAELTGQAVRELEERGEGARAVAVKLFRCDGAVSQLAIETAAPTRDAALLMRLFAERIEGLRDPLDPGFGYDSITLEIRAAEPLAADQRDFEASAAKAREQLSALLARLATRLGPERVTHWQAVDSHVPEGVFISSPSTCDGEGDRAKRGGGVAGKAGGLTTATPPSFATQMPPPHRMSMGRIENSRPLLLLDPPECVEAIAEVPDGPPYRFRWRGSQHRVARHEGPERIAMPWWDGRHKEARLTRDYYRVEDSDGRRFWLFRHGLYDEKPDPRWYMHGLFA